MIVQYFICMFFMIDVEGYNQICEQQYRSQFYCQYVRFEQCNIYCFSIDWCIVDILIVNIEDGVNNYYQYDG